MLGSDEDRVAIVMWHGLDDVARQAAHRRDLSVPSSDFDASIDTLSRALAAPLSRRRAIGAVAGGLLAAAALRPRLARAAGPDCGLLTPQKCTATATGSNGNAAQVCVGSDWHCCGNGRCAIACKPWERCTNGGAQLAGCSDTSLLCLAEQAPKFDARKSLYCSVQMADQGWLCSDYAPRTLEYGWCCLQSQKCGKTLGQCDCVGEVCGEGCCPRDTYCVGGRGCLRKCPGGGQRCGNDCCTGKTHCAGDHCACTPPSVECGTGCCNPKTTTADPNVRSSPWNFFGDLLGQSAARYGNGKQRVAGSAAIAGAGGAAAVAQIAAVNAQMGAALVAFSDGHRDSAFRASVKPATPKLPKLSAGDGLDAGSAAALSAMVSAQARAASLIAAAASCLARQRSASAKHDRSHARRQLLASARFSSEAAKVLKPIPKLRQQAAAALEAGHAPEVYATATSVTAFVDQVRKTGLPSDLRSQLALLGVHSPADLARVRKAMGDPLETVDSIAGGVLVAPISDSTLSFTMQTVATNLKAYATAARSHPIARSHG
jgi:hypothetical protein